MEPNGCWAVSQYSVIFFASFFFVPAKNGDCSRKCRGHQTILAWSNVWTASRPSRVKQMSFSAVVLGGRHYFSPHKMAAKITNYHDTAMRNSQVCRTACLQGANLSCVIMARMTSSSRLLTAMSRAVSRFWSLVIFALADRRRSTICAWPDSAA